MDPGGCCSQTPFLSPPNLLVKSNTHRSREGKGAPAGAASHPAVHRKEGDGRCGQQGGQNSFKGDMALFGGGGSQDGGTSREKPRKAWGPFASRGVRGPPPTLTLCLQLQGDPPQTQRGVGAALWDMG